MADVTLKVVEERNVAGIRDVPRQIEVRDGVDDFGIDLRTQLVVELKPGNVRFVN